MKTLKSGTVIELHGTPSLGGFPAVAPERATVCLWVERINGPRADPRMDGYHVVRFQDGGRLCVHESRFDVVKA